MASISVARPSVTGPSSVFCESGCGRARPTPPPRGGGPTRGFELLPTYRVPHYDILLPAVTAEHASTLLALFGAGQSNPFRRRAR